MKKMKKSFSLRQFVLAIACVISLLIFVILASVSNVLIKKQETQQMHKRWGYMGDVAQVSCFFSVNARVTEDKLEEFSHSVDSALEEASIISESENENARMWTDAYSANGQITISSEIGSITADAIGIGGDFFQFHPVQLLSGSYFSGNDLMQDYVILDELSAWKLFGSNDIAGQIVEINGVSHVVTGVVRHEESSLYEKAGLDNTLVYVSYDTLNKYGISNGINHYEIVMPNPVSGYAFNFVKDKLGVVETEVEIVENSSRYSLLNRLKQIGEFTGRSMNGKAIIYPYWENVARAYEDILALLTLFELLFLGFPVIIMIGTLILLWKRKTWTMKSVFLNGRIRQNMRLTEGVPGSVFKRGRSATRNGQILKNTSKEVSL